MASACDTNGPVIILGFIALLAIGACGGGDQDTGTTAAPSTDVHIASTTTATTIEESEMQETIDLAIADLVDRLQVQPDEISVVSAEPVTWPDGSLGCPQPGYSYTQAIVEGYRVVLEHGETTYDYHAGSDGRPFLCDRPTGRVPPTSSPPR